MKKWKLLLGTLALTVSMMASGCGGNEKKTSNSNNNQTTMKLGLTFADKHLLTQELHTMADNVNKRTDGKVKIEI